MLYIILFNNLFLGEDIVINCLGNQYKLGMVYDHCSNTPKLTHNINLPIFKKQQETRTHLISKLDIIDADNLYCKCGIDDNLKLSILTGLIEPHGAGAALIDHLSNTESIALHFKCTTKIEKKSGHRINLKEGTHIVDEVRYGIDAIFIIDKHTCHFGCDFDIVTKIKNAIDQESFEEMENIGGTLYVDDTVNYKLPFEVKTFKDMHCFISEVEQMLKEKKINSIPIEVKLKYQKPIYKIDLKLTEEVAIIIQHLNSALKKCAKLCKMYFLTQGMEIKIKMLEDLITEYRENLKQKLSKLLPKIREGSNDVVTLRTIIEKHSPFNKELDEEISAIKKEIGAFKKCISKIDDINGKEY